MPFEGGYSATLTIKAAPGKILRDPLRGNLISDTVPTVVPSDTFWRRRVRAGDAVLVRNEPDSKDKKITANV
jgi:hypothetical protein